MFNDRPGESPEELAQAQAELDMRGRFKNAVDARQFIRAGKATVTLVSKKTGNRFTYRVSLARDRETGEPSGDGTLFVGLLSGPDNNSDYQYMGRISRDVYWHGRKNPQPGDISKNALSVQAFAWTWRNLVQGTMPTQLQVWHEGRCGRCGRRLTVPSSIAQGFGPECIGHV